MGIIWLVVLIALGSGLAAVVAAAWGVLRMSDVLREPPRDVLILAAHQDDCVVLAGEYAIEAAKGGRRIEIVYLTCGAPDASDGRALLRRQEAVTAWGLLGVGPADLHHMGLPQASVSGPSRIEAKQLQAAGERLREVTERLAPGTAVFIPAAGESHVDHRTLRKLSLEAIHETGRSDLRILEAPEYNDHYSLLRCPWRSLIYVASNIPFLGRWVGSDCTWTRAGFVRGGPPLVLPPDPARLEKKRELPRQFRSEDGELLVKYFGHPDRFRPVDDVSAARNLPERTGRYFRFDERHLGASVLLLWLSLWLSAILISNRALWLAAKWQPWAAIVLTLAASIVLLPYGFRRQAMSRRAILLSIMVGSVWGTLQVV